jgi:hypothetical protein
MDIVIRIRRIDVFAVVSLLLHAIIFAIPLRQRPPDQLPGPLASSALTVELMPPTATPAPAQPTPPPEIAARPSPQRPTLARRTPAPLDAPRVPESPLPPLPAPATAAPVDMLAMIEARRAQRRAAEAASARGPPLPENVEPSSEEAAIASLSRNLQTLSGREGVGGVFQILHMGPQRAEFAFNGWRPDSQRKWREVIEVDAGFGGNVELAVVKRMIELIRTHYSGDFHWESHRLGRVVLLSARSEDSQGLEDFLVREFFGQQLLNPRP